MEYAGICSICFAPVLREGAQEVIKGSRNFHKNCIEKEPLSYYYLEEIITKILIDEIGYKVKNIDQEAGAIKAAFSGVEKIFLYDIHENNFDQRVFRLKSQFGRKIFERLL